MRRYFARSVALILLLLLGLLPLLFPATAQTPNPTFTPQPTVTYIPTITYGRSYTPQGCFQSLFFAPGSRITLVPGVNVRNIPSLSGAIVNYYTEEVVLTITEGPVCANGYNWWRVEGVGNPGWVIEGRPGRYFLAPAVGTPDPSTLCYPPLDFTIGERARTVTGVRVHTRASLSALAMTVLPLDTLILLLDGPVCADGINWWQARVPFGNMSVVGWVAEGFPENYWLETELATPTPTPFCPRPLRLPLGTVVGIVYDDAIARSLRASPSRSAPLVERLIGGVALELIGGPVCADGYNWWQAQIVTTNVTGWVAEGRPGDYWFDVLYSQPTPTPVG
jgi:hypothetical protein